MHFLSPGPARAGREGWIYSAPQDEPWAELAPCAGEEGADGADWYPRHEWTGEERASGSFARILGAVPGQTAFAWTGLRSIRAGAGKLHLTGSASGGFALYLDGRELYRSTEGREGDFRIPLELAFGRHQLVVRSICPSAPAKWDFRLDAPAEESGVRLEQPYPVEGLPDTWLYLGTFDPACAPAAEDVARMDTLFGLAGSKRFWRADLPDAAIRPYLETALHGKWNYPLGVTLYGILKTGEELEKPQYLNYAADHIEQCTSLHEYAMWDTEQFGAPGINHQLALIDSLDDCGSFGATMLTAHAARPLAGARETADYIAHYITRVQDRLPDGALYRVKGTTDFMMGTMWCDDLYMSTPFLGKYYALTGELSYLEDATRQFLLYKERMFIPEQQIMHHVFDHKFGKPNGVPWGRGNGWVLFSLTEILELLPAGHDLYQPLLAFFRELCQGYVRLQGPNGLWHQVLTDHSSYQEASCTSMFIYAFSRGIRFGWLEEQDVYADAALRAWEALMELCIDKQGNVYGVCRGSGYSFNKYYYKDQLGWLLNDTHGIGIVLLAGIECLKLARSRSS
ncbi:Unsaturated rhamnogalacturonyl hydrolase YesR [compost metagenome]